MKYNVGDLIHFNGNTHFEASDGGNGKSCLPGIAKIDMVANNTIHPYHVIAEDYGTASVYGWVNETDIVEINANEAISRLAYLNIINAPEYWRTILESNKIQYLGTLLINSAKKINKVNNTYIELTNAINNLVTAGVIGSPDYWTIQASQYNNIASLLIKLGSSVEIKKNNTDLRNKVITTAQSFLGYNEWDGSHRIIIDTYNKYGNLPRSYMVKYTDSWCATFVSVIAILCDIADTIIPRECSCEHQINLFKKLGTWEEDESQELTPGCIVYYVWDDSNNYAYRNETRWADHVGICVAVGQDGFNDGMNLRSDEALIIEGNKNDQVGYRTIKKANAKYVRGFARPNYSLV